MNETISIDNLIKKAKKQGVDFGKTDPYNRLRYYTKIGWLPHMTRQKDKKGDVKGHYPAWALDHLILIEELKAKGYSNEEISKKLGTKTQVVSVLGMLKNPESRNQIISYATLVLLLIIFGNELGIIKIGQSKSQIIPTTITYQNIEVIDRGTAFVPKGRNTVFVKTPLVNETSKVNITFNESYTPALRYWVADIKDYEGFMLELDTPIAESAEFNWWVTN